MTSFEQGFMDKLAMAGTAKVVRAMNKYLPRALGIPKLDRAETIMSGVRQLAPMTEEARYLADNPFALAVRRMIGRIISVESPFALNKHVNLSLRGYLTPAVQSNPRRTLPLWDDLGSARATATPLGIAGHEGTHAILNRANHNLAQEMPDFNFRHLSPSSRSGYADQLRRSHTLVSSLKAEAHRALTPTQYESAAAYDKALRSAGIKRPLAGSEVAADLGGRKFEQYIAAQRPDLYQSLSNAVRRKMVPRTEFKPDVLAERQPGSVLTWKSLRRRDSGWMPDNSQLYRR